MRKAKQPLLIFDADGYSTNAAFIIPEAFRAAFGIRMNTAKQWAQSTHRHFERGDVFYNHKAAYTESWSTALQHITRVIQVNRVFSNEGKEINESEYDEQAHVIEIIMYQPNPERTGLTRTETRPCTPIELSKLLMTGHW